MNKDPYLNPWIDPYANCPANPDTPFSDARDAIAIAGDAIEIAANFFRENPDLVPRIEQAAKSIAAAKPPAKSDRRLAIEAQKRRKHAETQENA
jgi:hypothetical protein